MGVFLLYQKWLSHGKLNRFDSARSSRVSLRELEGVTFNGDSPNASQRAVGRIRRRFI
jgi:hypothetical protein